MEESKEGKEGEVEETYGRGEVARKTTLSKIEEGNEKDEWTRRRVR